jgi:CheY-like chemotaxis protein
MNPVVARHCVLVVEDDPVMRDALVEVLGMRGFAACGVEHGHAAFQRLRDGYPACAVLLDLDMPIMNGWTFMDVHREDPRLASIPVFVLTGMPNPEREAQRIGAMAGLAKPVVLSLLLEMLATRCARH